jgi:hypothetical protein
MLHSNYGKETSVSCLLKVFQNCYLLSNETKMATTVQSGGIRGAFTLVTIPLARYFWVFDL